MLQWSTDAWKEELGRTQSIAHMAGAYLFAFGLGWLGMTFLPTGTLLWDLLVFDLFALLPAQTRSDRASGSCQSPGLVTSRA